MTAATREASVEWKQMTEAQRKPYADKYAEEKEVYATAIKEYKASGKEQTWKERVGIADIEARMAAKKEAAAAKKKEKALKKKTAAEAMKKKKAAAAEKKKAAEAKKKKAAE